MNNTLMTVQLIEAFDQSGSSPPEPGEDRRLIVPAFQSLGVYTLPSISPHRTPSTVVVGNLHWEVPPTRTGGSASDSNLVTVPVCFVPCDVERVFADGASEGFIPIQEAARRAGVHEETVRRAYRNNQLPAQRVGLRGIRVHPIDLKEWMAEGMPTRPGTLRRNQPAQKGGSHHAG